MKNQIIHTPEGVRDIYNKECKKKLLIQKRLHRMLHLYGYQDIQTPTFEFFDVFRKEIGTIPSKELYKFFDREGNTLSLRPDITPSIARAAATLFEHEEVPVRLCYMGNIFINHFSYQGRPKESTQLGGEFIGEDSVDADAEMIALVADCLKSAGLEKFQVTVGHVDFFESLMNEAAMDAKTEEQVRTLVSNRNYFGVLEILDTLCVNQKVKEAFEHLEEMTGGIEVLEKGRQYSLNTKAASAVKRLEKIYEVLKAYGVEEYITFDLSMSGTYGYYTGLIFRAYTFGTGDAIVKGGRYDHLIEKFGKESPSVGFAIVVDELVNALERQKVEIPIKDDNTLILYDKKKRMAAISLAKEFRDSQKNIEMMKRDPEQDLEVYAQHGRQNGAGSMIYLEEDEQIYMENLQNGHKKILKKKGE
ncbi:ATP phosphoribosyltransferase regulatory subunit [Lachnoclostridium sp. An181]|uniref:ATP phosphoribosyltransferase regulatory subunit n=1 Tax=Lachnoclostridium sp. An181 TaxID=1965575 RepID=UPI000B3A5BFE|nr:ATP phosphoribosyltransferase regulatory subunit [Lachnoclostridium sp. An181]OUP50961.1 ATP phosphoribosyltransferase regulatory subunit [Lachnoclostridium sp. An181]